MGTVNGKCVFATVSGKGFRCMSKYHYKDWCFFHYYCPDKGKPVNTEDYKECPIRAKEREVNSDGN